MTVGRLPRTAVTLAAVVAFAGGLAHAAATPVSAPRDTDPWWSPQGTTIAFAREAPTLDGSDVLFTPTVRGKEADILGAGRPRGFRPGSGELLVESGSSTNIRDAADHQIGAVPGIDATWSPDGTRIAFLQGDALAVSAANGTDVRQLARGTAPPSTDATGPAWSPDGTSIAIATGSALEIVPVDGSKPHVAFDGAGANPSWSHDGSTIAFERNVSGRVAIWLVAPDGTGAHEAIGGAANNRFPEWSPVDGRLAFLSDRSGAYALYAGTPDGAARELVGAVSPDAPARWSSSGDALAVSSARDCGRFGIYVVGSSPPVKPVRRSNQCRIDGTAAGDFITGTPYYDLIYGNAGNDAIFAANGADTVYGGTGNDRIGGGPGNDLIDGGPGNDVLSGGTGNDVIHAGPGLDKIGCGPGNDTAYVGPGDTVRACEHVHRSK